MRAPVRTGGSAGTATAAGLVGSGAILVTVLLYVRFPEARVASLPSPDVRGLHPDFDTFWHSAVALAQGPYAGANLYDTPAKFPNLNPPLLSVLLQPFAALDVLTAYRIFTGIMLALVVCSVLAVAAQLRLPAVATVAVLLTVFASSPLHGTLVLGQVYPILLAVLVAGWIAERRGRPVLASVCYGVAVALKPSLAPLLLLTGVQRRWKPFRAGIASAAAATGVGVAVAGPGSVVQWLTVALGEGGADTVDNASLPGLSMRFDLSPFPGLVAGLVVLVGTLVWCGRHRERMDAAGTAPWAVLAAGLLLSPIAWHNYLLLLVPGVLLLFAGGRRALAAALLVVTVVPVSWNAIWPDGLVADIAGSLYWLILVAYWLALVGAATDRTGDRAPVRPDPVPAVG